MDPSTINPHEVELREQDRWLPIANVARIMKHTLPPSAKVSKDAKECMQECVSELISFITSEASDKCLREKRKTINGEDVLFSMHDLGFENYAEVLKIYLAKYREQQALRQERGESRPSKRASKLSQLHSTDSVSLNIDYDVDADDSVIERNSDSHDLKQEMGGITPVVSGEDDDDDEDEDEDGNGAVKLEPETGDVKQTNAAKLNYGDKQPSALLLLPNDAANSSLDSNGSSVDRDTLKMEPASKSDAADGDPYF